MPEWGIKHWSSAPNTYRRVTDSPQWARDYRNDYDSLHGQILSALMTNYGNDPNGKGAWNHPPLFEYMDRFVSHVGPSDYQSEFANVIAFPIRPFVLVILFAAVPCKLFPLLSKTTV